MKLKDLIYNTEWLSVEFILLDLHPEVKDNIEDYKRIYNELNRINSTNSNIILEIDRVWEDGKETNFANVYGHDPTLPDDSISKGIAIEFRPRAEWLNYEIGMDAKEEWSELETICHSLIEMTFDGSTQEEIRENQNELLDQVNNIREEYFKKKNIDK